jgi:hypothetical protein
LTSNRRLPVVQARSGVIVPPEAKRLRVRRRNLASRSVAWQILRQNGGILLQRARVAGASLALVERINSLIQNQTNIDSCIGAGGGVAAQTLDCEVATLGNDVTS